MVGARNATGIAIAAASKHWVNEDRSGIKVSLCAFRRPTSRSVPRSQPGEAIAAPGQHSRARSFAGRVSDERRPTGRWMTSAGRSSASISRRRLVIVVQRNAREQPDRNASLKRVKRLSMLGYQYPLKKARGRHRRRRWQADSSGLIAAPGALPPGIEELRSDRNGVERKFQERR